MIDADDSDSSLGDHYNPGRVKSMVVPAATWPTFIALSFLVGILICLAQLCLARRILRAKADVPIFNQQLVLCLVVSGMSSNRSCRCYQVKKPFVSSEGALYVILPYDYPPATGP